MFQQSKLHYLGKSHRQPVLFQESLQNVLSDFDKKKDFLTSQKPGKVARWRSFFKCTSELGNTYQLPFLYTTETKLRVFQFKFLHRGVATNDFLLKIGKKETDSCSFCADSPETLTHLFWHCRSTQTFWNNVSQWTSEELDLTNLNITPFSPALCLGLIDNISNLLLHHFLLIARHYIYSCKLRNTIPMVQVYTQLVIRSMEIEKQIAFDNNNLASFRKKWATFKQCPSEYNLTNTVN